MSFSETPAKLESMESAGNWKEGHPHALRMSQEMQKAGVEHRSPKTMADYLAYAQIFSMRQMVDVMSGYRRPFQSATSMRETSEKAWLTKTLQLENMAVPVLFTTSIGRYWRSLGRLKQDKGWVHSLLDDAENERMHLTNWMFVKQPGLLMRMGMLMQQTAYSAMVGIGQIAFPSIGYRLNAYIEETGLTHYRLLLREIEREGSPVHHWKYLRAPDVAIEYWKLGENGTIADVVRHIIADEETHLEIYHELASDYQNLKNKTYPSAPAAF